uniref:Expressed protein n=1 Tax=Echinococcus granulosus TaxID=6210 RepID=A0A068WEF8_ECHGR|nr:expressed protein [Echinococcus granulosus]
MRVSRQPLLVDNSAAVAWRRWWSSAGVASGGVQPLISSLDRHMIHVSNLSSILTNGLTAAKTPKDLCEVVRDVLILGLCVFFTFVVTLALSLSAFARIYAFESDSNGLLFAHLFYSLSSVRCGAPASDPTTGVKAPALFSVAFFTDDALWRSDPHWLLRWLISSPSPLFTCLDALCRLVRRALELRWTSTCHLSLIRYTVQFYFSPVNSIFPEHFFIFILSHPAWPNSRYLLRLC